MQQLERLGKGIEMQLSEIDEMSRSPLKGTLMGVAMAAVVMAGGIATFLLVLFILVNVFG